MCGRMAIVMVRRGVVVVDATGAAFPGVFIAGWLMAPVVLARGAGSW